MQLFYPLHCKILLLALVFSLFLDSRETTFFIIFGLKIVSGASVASGHPLHMLCFLYSGEPCPPRPIFLHFFTFFGFFIVLQELPLPQNFASRCRILINFWNGAFSASSLRTTSTHQNFAFRCRIRINFQHRAFFFKISSFARRAEIISFASVGVRIPKKSYYSSKEQNNRTEILLPR